MFVFMLILLPMLVLMLRTLMSHMLMLTLKVEPYYCMAWVLTWFAHDLPNLHAVARLYDVLLGAHPSLIIYISAAVSLHQKNMK